jgi:hypothetical protein
MSLDMTVGAREAALDSNDDEIEAPSIAAATPVWLANLMMVAATAAGVTMCSALGVLLFLR